jgi:hypothetical protein
MAKNPDVKQSAASPTMSAWPQTQTGMSAPVIVDKPTLKDTGSDPNPIVATIALRRDGDVAWVDYEDGPYVVDPIVDFSAGKAIDLEASGIRYLDNVFSYALLQLRRPDNTPYFCYVKTPRWW